MIEGEWRPTEKPLFIVRVCINKRMNTDRLPSCAGRGSRGLADLLERMILEERIPASVTRGPCMNNCMNGPNLKVQGGDFFSLEDKITDENIARIMDAVRAEAVRRRALAAEAVAAICSEVMGFGAANGFCGSAACTDAAAKNRPSPMARQNARMDFLPNPQAHQGRPGGPAGEFRPIS